MHEGFWVDWIQSSRGRAWLVGVCAGIDILHRRKGAMLYVTHAHSRLLTPHQLQLDLSKSRVFLQVLRGRLP